MKQEPEDYSWDDFVEDGGTAWTGVRNFQARNNLRAMSEGDAVLFYHSGKVRAVVGTAEVGKQAYADPTVKEGDWVCVDLIPKKALSSPVTLADVKARASLSEIALVRNSRLSVMPLKAGEYREIVGLSR